MTFLWIAARLIREISRDRRTMAFFFLVPVVVMSLVYLAVAEDEVARIGVLTRGTARLFEGDLTNAIETQDDVELVPLDIPDELTDETQLEQLILEHLRSGKADGILYMGERLLADRFDGRPGTLHVYVEGSRPTITGLVLGAIGDAMDDLAAALPVVIDAECSAFCASSVNNKPMDLEKHYFYGSEDYRVVDFFLPVFPPFFVFFFTFIVAVIQFQRERARGTLERLMVSPVAFAEVVVGYVTGFLVFATLQAAIVVAYILVLLSFPVSAAEIASIAVVTLLMMLISLLLGLALSFLAKNEFQAIQFIPLVLLPQIFLSDMIWDIRAFPAVIRWFSYVLPLTYANDAMRGTLIRKAPLWAAWPSLLALLGFSVLILLVLVAISRHPRGDWASVEG
jgi:ABC-2 type transport system permease protein